MGRRSSTSLRRSAGPASSWASITTLREVVDPDRVDRTTHGRDIAVLRDFGQRAPDHGFRFASVMGEVVADLVERGETSHDLALLRLSRFDSSSQPSE